MLYLTTSDKSLLEKDYRTFLLSLKTNLSNSNIQNVLELYALINYLLRTGKFSWQETISYQSNFNYLALPNMPEQLQVMYGIGCCRHINQLINDILLTLGFNSVIQYIRVDNTDTWHRATPKDANHLVVILKDNNKEYLLDAYNNFAFQIIGTDLIPLNLPTPKCLAIATKYPDDNIKEIGQVLKKYYNLQEYGIDYVYDYGY